MLCELIMFLLDEDKIERVLFEQKKSEEDHQQRFEQMELMISQVLCTTFTPQGCQQGALCGGPEVIRRRTPAKHPYLTYLEL